MLRTGILFSLCFTSLALECFVRTLTDPCATTQKCNDGEICEIVKQPGATTQSCISKERCGATGGFCCDKEECNIDEQNNSTNITETGITCVIGTIIKNVPHTSTGTCQLYCRREVSAENGIVVSQFGCGNEDNCKNNKCFIDFNGREVCCCDSDNCNGFNAPKNVSLPHVKNLTREVETAKCYTTTNRGLKVLDCKPNEVCMKKGNIYGCVTKEDEVCQEGHCCIGDKCNKDEVPKEVKCTTGVFGTQGNALIEKNTTMCQFGCTRINLEETITFSCAGNECIGKLDGCAGDRCCCFENDCWDFGRYALPKDFESMKKVLSDSSVALLVPTSFVTLLILVITW